jgi:thioredoxin reductase (NADPH)
MLSSAPAENVYAIGDIVFALDQISVAMGQAAVAATTLHNDLREEDGQAKPS